MSFKDDSALIVGTFVAVFNSKGDGNPAPVRLRGFIIINRRPVNVRAHNCYKCSSVPFLSMNFQLVKGGGCRLRQKPATARNHPTPNDGYQACISHAKAMEGRPSRPAFPARRSFPRAPFPRVEPWLVRTLPFRTSVCALFPRPEALPARCSFVPKPCPCTDRSL